MVQSRRKTGTSYYETVPTALVRSTCLTGTAACDLSEYGVKIYNPSTGIAGVGRSTYAATTGSDYKIPQSALNSAAIKVLSLLPAPSTTAISNNYVAAGTGGFNDDAFNTRIDYQLKPNLHIFGRYSFANFKQDGAPSFGAIGGKGYGDGAYAGHGTSQDHSIASGFDYAVNSTLLTDFRFGYFRYHVINNKYDASNLTAATDLGMAGLNTGAADTAGLPTLNFTDTSAGITFSSLGDDVSGCNCPLHETEQQYQFVNNWTKVYRNHSFKFGADLRYALNLRSASDNNRTGLMYFDSTNTADATAGGGLSLATMLLGDVSQFKRFVVTSNNAGEHQKRFFLYGQDTWRITPKLTLTLGLRWEDVFPETVSEKGEGGWVDLKTGYLNVAGVGGIPTNGGQQNKLTNFAPRIGVAYQLGPKTAIRAGYGRSFDEGIFGLIFGSAMTHNPPVVATDSKVVTDQYTPVVNLTAGPAPFVPQSIPANGQLELSNSQSYVSARPPQMKLVTVDSWNLSIQRQVTNSVSAEIAYVGNWGADVPAGYAGYNINQARVGAGSQVSRRPLYNKYSYADGTTCCSQDLSYVSPDAHSNYNSLQAQVNKRMSNGLQFSAFYTWSKAFDHTDDYFYNDPRVQYGPVDFNRKHVFTANAIYDLPIGRGKAFLSNSSKLLNYFVGGYQLSSLSTWASGLPFTWQYAECSVEVDSGPCRPDRAGSFSYGAGSLNTTTHTVQYFTPVAPLTTEGAVSGAFRRPQLYQFGNVGRNSGVGPRMFTSDLALSKNFDFTERVKAQFRMDTYNLFNHPVLAGPSNTSVDSAAAGTITGLQGYTYMRRLEFGARFSF